jgi:hypothetical protein
VVPQSATLQAGQVVALKASLTDEHGDRLQGFVVSWRSSNDAVATSTIRVLARGQKPDPNGVD